MSRLRRVVAALGVGVATLSLAAAGARAGTQPDDSCLQTFRDRPVSAHGVQGRSSVIVQTTRSERGRIAVYVTGDLDTVHVVDGAAHTVAGVLYFQVRGEAQRQPTPFRFRATPSGNTNAFDDPLSATVPNYLELDGSHYLHRQVRAVVHVFGDEYPSGWATIGRGAPSCEP